MPLSKGKIEGYTTDKVKIYSLDQFGLTNTIVNIYLERIL